MTIQELLQYAENQVFEKTGKHLDSLQKSILEGVLKFNTYQQIANNIANNNEYHYSEDYLKDKGANLWKILSQVFEEDIKKANIRSILENKVSSTIYSFLKSPQTQLGSNYINNNIKNSHINICRENQESVKDNNKESTSELTEKLPKLNLRKLPNLIAKYGRHQEIFILKTWLLENNTNLINIYGLKEIGKTALVNKLISEITSEFDYIIYFSFDYKIRTLSTLKHELKEFFSSSETTSSWEVIDYLQSSRCLVIIDDIDNIFEKGKLAGKYLKEYNDYGKFFKQVTSTYHQSSLILISSEKLPNIPNSQSLYLQGLGESAKELLKEKDLKDEETWDKLITVYQGNPSWLNIIADTINDLFDGKVSDFLTDDNELFLGDITESLSEILERLSESEIKVIQWLSTQNKPINIKENLSSVNLSNLEFQEIIESLVKRCLIEKFRSEKYLNFQLNDVFLKYIKRDHNLMP